MCCRARLLRSPSPCSLALASPYPWARFSLLLAHCPAVQPCPPTASAQSLHKPVPLLLRPPHLPLPSSLPLPLARALHLPFPLPLTPAHAPTLPLPLPLSSDCCLCPLPVSLSLSLPRVCPIPFPCPASALLSFPAPRLPYSLSLPRVCPCPFQPHLTGEPALMESASSRVNGFEVHIPT